MNVLNVGRWSKRLESEKPLTVVVESFVARLQERGRSFGVVPPLLGTKAQTIGKDQYPEEE